MRAALRTVMVFALAGASAAATAARAAQPTTVASSSDVRCLMTMVALAQQKDAQAQMRGQLGVYFFAGRIAARGRGFNLAAAMRAEAPSLNPQLELNRCVQIVGGSVKGVQVALQTLNRSAPAPARPPQSSSPFSPATPFGAPPPPAFAVQPPPK